jgi:uncharacterized protein (TIGR03067 family)
MVAVVFCLAAEAKDDAKKDQEKLQGDWTFVSGERDGQPFPEELAQSLKRTMTKDKFTIRNGEEVVSQGTFKLDPSQKPKTIELKVEGSDQPVHGIYELDGDMFKICYAAPGEERPKKFSTQAGSGHTLGVWKRAKK